MPYFKHDHLEFHYLERGSGMPFFFQHGLGGDTEKIFALVELPDGFRLLGLDCRAHGKSTPLGQAEKLRFDTFADDLVALMDKLKIPRAIFGGTSMGAGVALNCALRHSERALGLVLLRPAWLDAPNQANAKLFGLIAQLLRSHGPTLGWKHFAMTEAYASVASQSLDTAESLRGLFQDPGALEAVARLEQIPQDAPNFDRAAWRRVSIPTLVLATRHDPVHPFEYGQVLAREIPGAQFQELTPKSVNLTQYTSELRQSLARFLQAEFPAHSNPFLAKDEPRHPSL
jgi:pimeloyl-ACP methyl ester carboxylesterase